MRILVLAYGSAEAASTHYRYRACKSLWAAQGHEVEITPVRNQSQAFWRGLASFDIIINQKALLSRRLGRRIFGAGRPVFFDFDDVIWTRPSQPYSWWTQWRVDRRIRWWFSRINGIFAANNLLADFARRFTSNVHFVPMALDLKIWHPTPKNSIDYVRIGWAGSPGNLRYLESLRGPLHRVLQANPNVRLSVFCGQRPAWDVPYEYIPYAPGNEREFIAKLDIGLLPLPREAYSLGKSPIKALQYLSCAVPVVGNAPGATAEILQAENSLIVESEADWQTALQHLLDHSEERTARGLAGRQHVERNYDLRVVSQNLLTLLLTIHDA